MALDIIGSVILKPLLLVKKKYVKHIKIYKTSKNICKISFDNKNIEEINLSCNFYDTLAKVAFPLTSPLI